MASYCLANREQITRKTMSAIIANPKDDLISQATERRTTFPRLALREQIGRAHV